ncbi:hypothetical protein EAG_09051 [Camponotus floridanus]|uniref:Uncharacterized protein n=1 Tax=Camponotus floridanus TaxID=104421 RepID=E2AH63_CAMFO|nr:hypothetical protein EAG_09051 [Camponotus floridanus]
MDILYNYSPSRDVTSALLGLELGSRGCAVVAAQHVTRVRPSNAEVNRGDILEHSGFPAAAIRVRASEGGVSCEFCSAVRRLRASVYERVRARAPRKGESREGTTVFVARVGSGALRVTVSDTPRGTCSPSIETRVSHREPQPSSTALSSGVRVCWFLPD